MLLIPKKGASAPFDNMNETQNIPPCEILQIEEDKDGLILIICGILTHQMQRNKGYNGENSYFSSIMGQRNGCWLCSVNSQLKDQSILRI